MAKPRDSKFNKRFSTVDRIRPDKAYVDWEKDKEHRTCQSCEGKLQEGHEHLRFFHGKFMCQECRKIEKEAG